MLALFQLIHCSMMPVLVNCQCSMYCERIPFSIRNSAIGLDRCFYFHLYNINCYCCCSQGMSFLVGLLLLLGMREEECFWSFTALLKTKQLAGLYQGTLPLLHLRLYQLDRLIELRLPKLFSHFKEECMYCLLLFCKR